MIQPVRDGLLIVAGLVLVANPIYLDSLRSQAWSGWDFTAYFAATTTALGVLWILIGADSMAGERGSMSVRRIVLGMALVAIGYIPVTQLVVLPNDPVAAMAALWIQRKVFLASVVAMAFVAGAGVGNGDQKLFAAGIAFPLLVVLLNLPTMPHSVRLFLVDLVFVTFTWQILGVPFLGGMVFVAAFGSGFVFGRQRADSVRSGLVGE